MTMKKLVDDWIESTIALRDEREKSLGIRNLSSHGFKLNAWIVDLGLDGDISSIANCQSSSDHAKSLCILCSILVVSYLNNYRETRSDTSIYIPTRDLSYSQVLFLKNVLYRDFREASFRHDTGQLRCPLIGPFVKPLCSKLSSYFGENVSPLWFRNELEYKKHKLREFLLSFNVFGGIETINKYFINAINGEYFDMPFSQYEHQECEKLIAELNDICYYQQEGGVISVFRDIKTRSSKARQIYIKLCKQEALESGKSYTPMCDICNMSYLEYGPLTENVFEVVHKIPISDGLRETKISLNKELSDLALNCGNCHNAYTELERNYPELNYYQRVDILRHWGETKRNNNVTNL